MKQRLFKRVNGKNAFWEAEAKDGILFKRWARTPTGKVTEREKSFVGKGKQGRSCQEQAEFMLLSEVNSQVNDGYVFEEAHCDWPVTNSLGFPLPMLATDIRKLKTPVDYDNCSLTPKLNGHRMMLGINPCLHKLNDPRYAADGKATLYSRGGQKIDLPHIFDEVYATAARYNLQLDGEVYHHGTPLQTIKSMVAAKSEHLTWHIYDLVSALPHDERRTLLQSRIPAKWKHTTLVPNYPKITPEKSRQAHKEYLALGYEGTMLRWGPEGYADDARPKFLTKQKDFIDEEFEIVNMVFDEPRKDKKGQLLLCPSFILLNNDGSGTEFKATVHGNMYEKHNRGRLGADHWKGKHVTVSYQERSKDGIPTICTVLGEREDL